MEIWIGFYNKGELRLELKVKWLGWVDFPSDNRLKSYQGILDNGRLNFECLEVKFQEKLL